MYIAEGKVLLAHVQKLFCSTVLTLQRYHVKWLSAFSKAQCMATDTTQLNSTQLPVGLS